MEESPYAPYGEMVAAASVLVAGGLTGNNYRVVSAALATAVFTVTLDTDAAIDPRSAGILITARSATAAVFAVQPIGDNVYEVRPFNAAGTPTAVAFDICFFRKGMI